MLELGAHGIRRTEWQDLDLVAHWRTFLDRPETYFREARIKAREQVQESIRAERALRRRLQRSKRKRLDIATALRRRLADMRGDR